LFHEHDGSELDNLEVWNVKKLFRDSYLDEIVYSIIFGIENIRPNKEICYGKAKNSWQNLGFSRELIIS
jgi:hypothetical protein